MGKDIKELAVEIELLWAALNGIQHRIDAVQNSMVIPPRGTKTYETERTAK